MANNRHKVIAIIGGGASGLAAAVFADKAAKKAGADIHIVIYESNSRLGKKILVTGNGRCNFSNIDLASYHFHGEPELAEYAAECFNDSDTAEFFRSGGVFSRTDNAGRIYPLSNQASSVLDFFRNEIQKRGIEIKTDFKITDIKRTSDEFVLNGSEKADAVILACGGKASPVHGSDGSVFHILNALGIKYTKLYPALVPLCISDFTKSLKGIRAEGKIAVKQNGKTIAEDCGELQYTDYGISGIPAMQVSGRAAPLLESTSPVYVYVDSAPSIESDELKDYISDCIKSNPNKPTEMLLSGIMPKRLGVYLLAELSFKQDKPVKTINISAADKIVAAVKNKKYKLSSVKSFADAQVTSGGVPASELDIRTLETKKIKKLFICGETVNVDGDCGGYNLQWAWSSAFLAASSAVGELTNAQN